MRQDRVIRSGTGWDGTSIGAGWCLDMALYWELGIGSACVFLRYRDGTKAGVVQCTRHRKIEM